MRRGKILSPRYLRFGVIGVVLQAEAKYIYILPVAVLHKCLITCILTGVSIGYV